MTPEYLIILLAAILNAACVWHLNFKRRQYRKLWHETADRLFAMRKERDEWQETSRMMTDGVRTLRAENERMRKERMDALPFGVKFVDGSSLQRGISADEIGVTVDEFKTSITPEYKQELGRVKREE